MTPRLSPLKLALALTAVLYLVQGLYYARVLAPSHDAVEYLLIGSKLVKGEIGVYDDRLPGNRLPLPFYILGLTQVLAGPSLRAARWLNIGLGLLTLLLTAAMARRLAGDGAGILAALFLATQGVVVAYYSYEGYPAFAAFCVACCLLVLFGDDSPGRRVFGNGLVALLFFVRSNLWPAVPFLLGYSLWRASGTVERAVLVSEVVIPPLTFFAWDSSHLKLLAYVPILQRLVAPLGYASTLRLDARPTLPFAEEMWEAARLVRRYEFWVLATIVLVALLSWQRRRGRPARPWDDDSRATVLAIFLAYMLASNFLFFTWTWKWVGFYFLSVAPLVAVLLGVGFSALFQETRPRSGARLLLVVVLGSLLLPPLYFVRNPLLPVGEFRAKDPFRAAHVAATHLARAVPRDAKVFFFGQNPVYYLSDLPQTFLQQFYYAEQFPRIPVDDWAARRSGFVPLADMRNWLTTDATYAVIDTAFLQFQRETWGPAAPENEMKTLVSRHFELVDTIGEYPYTTYLVYRRKAPQNP